MFSVGIFTTHIPYIAMIAFYAFFLLFGVEKAREEKIKLTEKSVSVEYHLNSFNNTQVFNTVCFYTHVTETIPQQQFEKLEVKQKWKFRNIVKFSHQEYSGNPLFCRPPPAVA